MPRKADATASTPTSPLASSAVASLSVGYSVSQCAPQKFPLYLTSFFENI
ncbi:hypothetical protein [Chryseobacterium artocarpi]|nr:hypothetical protein [Chryseobacterium artocarpi]